jgi:hypothetical protein
MSEEQKAQPEATRGYGSKAGERKAYHAPQLDELGDIKRLTRATNAVGGELDSGPDP